MEKTDWLTKNITEYKKCCYVIPIKSELLGFVGGDYTTAALLTQLLYWRDRTRIKGGWIAKSAKNWFEELYISQRQVSRITKQLVKLKLIETKLKKFNGSPMTHYRLRETEFKKVFIQYLETGASIFTKGENPIRRKGKIDFDEKDKSILPNGRNSIGQNGEMNFVEKAESITEPTTKLTIKPTTEKKAERVCSSYENNFSNKDEKLYEDADVVPKEKSCGKKEKGIIQLPFESDVFQQTWDDWKSYVSEKFNREYSKLEEQAALKPLHDYDEAFAVGLIIKAISGSWKSFQFSNTSDEFQKHLINKNKNYNNANKIDTDTGFRKAVNDKGNELWGSFN